MKQYFIHSFEVRSKVLRLFVAMTLLGLSLTACMDSTDNPVDPAPETTTGDDASDMMPFKVIETTINSNGDSSRKVTLRYYDDMPHVAYIAVDDFQHMLAPSKSIKVNKTAASQYLLVTSKGETAMVNTAEESMMIDGNFDRVFDDNDKTPRHPQLNIAIMTSHYAFSSGNLLPSLMKDYGYLIIGEKSGGGSCSIQRMCTAEGLCYILSTSRMRLTNKAGENIDSGVVPQIALEVKQATGKDDYGENVQYSDFSAFYAPSVGEQIVNWYANKQ